MGGFIGGYNPLIRITSDPKFQRDIQAGGLVHLQIMSLSSENQVAPKRIWIKVEAKISWNNHMTGHTIG